MFLARKSKNHRQIQSEDLFLFYTLILDKIFSHIFEAVATPSSGTLGFSPSSPSKLINSFSHDMFYFITKFQPLSSAYSNNLPCSCSVSATCCIIICNLLHQYRTRARVATKSWSRRCLSSTGKT